jgi:hypothetical protein
MTPLSTYRRWAAEAAAYTGPDVAGAKRGMDDAMWAEALELSRMLEAGEVTMVELMEEARNGNRE